VKRIIWQAFLILFVGAILAMIAFGPRPDVAIPPGRVRISYWEKWNGLEADQAKEIVTRFNETVGKEKNIWVDYVSISEVDRKTLVSTAAGMPPDVSGVWDKQVCQFASMGALEDLGPMAQKRGLTREHFKPVFYDGCTYQGKLYALPSTVFSVALIWNKEVFQQKAKELRAAGLEGDVVFECSGDNRAIGQALALARPAGKVVVVGIPHPDEVCFDSAIPRRRELTLLFSRRSRNTLEEAVRMLAEGRLDLSAVPLRRFSLEQAATALEATEARPGNMLRAMVAP